MEHPIIFSEQSVRAILKGGKTRTRRVIKNINGCNEFLMPERNIVNSQEMLNKYPENSSFTARYCPYGKIGDLLWVREGLRRYKRLEFLEERLVDVPEEKQKWTAQYISTGTPVLYALGAKEGWCGIALWQWKNKAISPVFMPRWASRITLEITGIQVEQLQDISTEDAMEEGLEETGPEQLPGWIAGDYVYSNARHAFRSLWNSINEKRGYSWSSNPWVWVIEFKVLSS